MPALILQGRYAGQVMVLKPETLAAGVADGWAKDLTDEPSPYSTEGINYDVYAAEPASLLEWYDDLDPADPYAPPEPPVIPPAPTIASLSPNTAVAASVDDVEMLVTGTGFTNQSVIVFNGHDEPIVFYSDTEISTLITCSIFLVADTVSVEVRDAGGTSNSLDFTFTEPVIEE